MREFMTVAGMQRMGLIKSIQRGTLANGASSSGTATISSVVTSNAMVIHSVLTQAGTGSDQSNTYARIILTDATTLTLNLGGYAGFSTTIAWQVIEFFAGVLKSLQRGTIDVASSGTSGTATITAVDVNKAFVINSGASQTTSVTHDMNATWFQTLVTDLTTITATRDTAAAVAFVVGYQVPEFF